MYDIKKTGEIIKRLRMQKGKSQECIAEELGINIKTYRAIETGTRGGRVDTLSVIAQYFDVTIDYLIHGEMDEIMGKLLVNLDGEKRGILLNIIKELIYFVGE